MTEREQLDFMVSIIDTCDRARAHGIEVTPNHTNGFSYVAFNGCPVYSLSEMRAYINGYLFDRESATKETD